MAGGHYEKDMYRQLQETMLKLDRLENQRKEDIQQIKWDNAKKIDEIKRDYEEKIDGLNQIIKQQAEEINVLKQENVLLREDNERLKSILRNDSSNSSQPPSTDQKGKRINQYNSRETSKRAKGAQPGHTGKTLTKEIVVKRIETGVYKHEVVEHGVTNGKSIVKYVVDLRIIPLITEHRFYADETGNYNIPKELHSDVTYGNMVRALAVQLYGVGVVSNERIRELINSISGDTLALSAGGVYKMIRRFSKSIANEIEHTKQKLLSEKAVYTDGTNITVNGKQAYIRNISTANSVYYAHLEKKNLESMRKLPVLPTYTGTLIHDHETALYHFGIEHGECNVHLLRHLVKNTEDTGHLWSDKMRQFLCQANQERKYRIENKNIFTDQELAFYADEFDRLITSGSVENESCNPKWAKKKERSLLRRLAKYKLNHLLFLHDFTISFDNNLSERDLRKCKTRQKMAGGFRVKEGAEMYCNILSFIETCKRCSRSAFSSILSVLRGEPVLC